MSEKAGFFRRLFRRRKKEQEPAADTPEQKAAKTASERQTPPQAAAEPAEQEPAGKPASAAVPEKALAQEAEPPAPPPAATAAASDALPETAGEAGGESAAPREDSGAGWLARLRRGLRRSSSALGEGIAGIFTRRRLDAETLQELEDILIQADLGIDMAERVIERLKHERFEKGVTPEEVKAVLSEEIARVLRPVEVPFEIDPEVRPFVVLVVGVNGSGKTTTIGKLAAIARREGHSVMLVAGDTFRAAAVEQLGIWAERTGARFMKAETGADAAALAFDALRAAREEGTDIVFMDTAGRLQNRRELMDELAKIVRVMKKVIPEAPHAVLLVLDATVGQNAISQVEVFREVAGVTGIVMTKLDGTARGGILVAIAERFGLPVHAIGVGEGIDDLQPFDATAFARAIAGLDDRETEA
jgi:fused signal recognition particle receptor